MANEHDILLILGMHRSGTSVLAGTCGLLGADMGGEMMAAGQDNVMGFWEHDEIVRIHDQLLDRLGFAWDDVRALPEKWWTYDTIRPQREALIEVLKRDFSSFNARLRQGSTSLPPAASVEGYAAGTRLAASVSHRDPRPCGDLRLAQEP